MPRIVPSAVSLSGRDSEAVSRLSIATPAGGRVAIPKSSSFTPDLVNITLAGFKSRCTTPDRCALSRASQIWVAYSSARMSGSGARSNRRSRVSPSMYSMTR